MPATSTISMSTHGWAVALLLDRIDVAAGFHDPVCGGSTTLREGRRRGIPVTGADLVDRGLAFPKISAGECFPVRDYRTDETVYCNVGMNLPYADELRTELLPPRPRPCRRRRPGRGPGTDRFSELNNPVRVVWAAGDRENHHLVAAPVLSAGLAARRERRGDPGKGNQQAQAAE
jgi:hypothetical protein